MWREKSLCLKLLESPIAGYETAAVLDQRQTEHSVLVYEHKYTHSPGTEVPNATNTTAVTESFRPTVQPK